MFGYIIIFFSFTFAVLLEIVALVRCIIISIIFSEMFYSVFNFFFLSIDFFFGLPIFHAASAMDFYISIIYFFLFVSYFGCVSCCWCVFDLYIFIYGQDAFNL